jgi:hypothetical protein
MGIRSAIWWGEGWRGHDGWRSGGGTGSRDADRTASTSSEAEQQEGTDKRQKEWGTARMRHTQAPLVGEVTWDEFAHG